MVSCPSSVVRYKQESMGVAGNPQTGDDGARTSLDNSPRTTDIHSKLSSSPASSADVFTPDIISSKRLLRWTVMGANNSF